MLGERFTPVAGRPERRIDGDGDPADPGVHLSNSGTGHRGAIALLGWTQLARGDHQRRKRHTGWPVLRLARAVSMGPPVPEPAGQLAHLPYRCPVDPGLAADPGAVPRRRTLQRSRVPREHAGEGQRPGDLARGQDPHHSQRPGGRLRTAGALLRLRKIMEQPPPDVRAYQYLQHWYRPSMGSLSIVADPLAVPVRAVLGTQIEGRRDFRREPSGQGSSFPVQSSGRSSAPRLRSPANPPESAERSAASEVAHRSA